MTLSDCIKATLQKCLQKHQTLWLTIALSKEFSFWSKRRWNYREIHWTISVSQKLPASWWKYSVSRHGNGQMPQENPRGRNQNSVWLLLLQQVLILQLYMQLVHQSAPQSNNVLVKKKTEKINFDRVGSYNCAPPFSHNILVHISLAVVRCHEGA